MYGVTRSQWVDPHLEADGEFLGLTRGFRFRENDVDLLLTLSVLSFYIVLLGIV